MRNNFSRDCTGHNCKISKNTDANIIYEMTELLKNEKYSTK